MLRSWMKILLDECITRKLAEHLDDFEVATVAQKKWKGHKNSVLLKKAEEEAWKLLCHYS